MDIELIKKRDGREEQNEYSSSFEDSSHSQEIGEFTGDHFEISLNEDLNLMVPVVRGEGGTVVSGGGDCGEVGRGKDGGACSGDRGGAGGEMGFGGRDSMGGDFGVKKNSLVSLDDEILLKRMADFVDMGERDIDGPRKQIKVD